MLLAYLQEEYTLDVDRLHEPEKVFLLKDCRCRLGSFVKLLRASKMYSMLKNYVKKRMYEQAAYIIKKDYRE